MRASDIVEPAPTVSEDATVLDAIRLVAVEGQPGVVVVDADGRLRAVLPASQVMRLLIPGYVRDDLSLARMWDEAHADDLARVLASTALREVMPAYREVPTVDADATLMEVAAVMAAGFAWVAGSDRALALLIPDPARQLWVGTLKGTLFVAVTGLVLFVLELKIVSHGLLTLGGIACVVFGSMMLFPGPIPELRLPLAVVLPGALVLAGGCAIAVRLALRAQRERVTTGAEGLCGEVGTATSPLDPEGKVSVHGEIWSAVAQGGAYRDRDGRPRHRCGARGLLHRAARR